jgi:hypothetical protein
MGHIPEPDPEMLRQREFELCETAQLRADIIRLVDEKIALKAKLAEATKAITEANHLLGIVRDDDHYLKAVDAGLANAFLLKFLASIEKTKP